ncbi:hypothetical protein ACOME3_000910 [Neoechinorhynchus agilis]
MPNSTKIKHVLHIGIDGLKPNCLDIGQNKPDNIMHRIGRRGSLTLEKGLTSPITYSAPCWALQLCSMNVERTGMLDNSWIPPWPPFNHSNLVSSVLDDGGYLPTAFRVLKQANPKAKTALIYDWPWFKYLGSESIKGSIDWEFYSDRSEKCKDHSLEIATNAVRFLKTVMNDKQIPLSYSFIYAEKVSKASFSIPTREYFNEVDAAGHSHGWCSQEYLEALKRVDDSLGLILDEIDSSQTLIVLSSDHGGEEFGHSKTSDQTLRIPVMFAGAGVKENYIIQNWVSGGDILPTVFYLLGLKEHKLWQGKRIKEILIDEVS